MPDNANLYCIADAFNVQDRAGSIHVGGIPRVLDREMLRSR
jgi:hypothetical protein